MKALVQITRQQNIEEIFAQELEQIYYPGYLEQMSTSNPDRLEWELEEFESQFSKKNYASRQAGESGLPAFFYARKMDSGMNIKGVVLIL
jgi:hypothetical protein